MLATNAPEFRFILFSAELGRLVLEVDPIGWDALGLNLHRDRARHGMASEFTVQLGFVLAGRAYLLRLLALRGIEAACTLRIEELDGDAFAWEEYYTGRVNFTGREITDTEFRVNIEQQGFAQRFLGRLDTQVDLFKNETVAGLALPALAPTTVRLHSRAIAKRYVATMPTPALASASNFVTDGESRAQVLYFGFGPPQIDDFNLGLLPGGPVTNPTGVDRAEVALRTTDDKGTYHLAVDLRSTLVCKLTASSGQGDFDKVSGGIYYHFNDEPETLLLRFADSGIVGDYYKELNTRLEVTRELGIGDKIYFYGKAHVDGVSGNVLGNYRFELYVKVNPGSSFTLEALTRTQDTECPGVLIYEALERVAQAISDEPDALYSEYFGRTDTVPAYAQDGAGSGQLVTGGFQVRGFPLPSDIVFVLAGQTDPRKTLSASWQDLFGAQHVLHYLGWGLERRPDGHQVVRCEPVAHFYQDIVVLDLSEFPLPATLPDSEGSLVANLRTTPQADASYNQVEIGYQKWQTGSTNGLDEFNAKRQWTTPLTQVSATYSADTSYITSGFYLENTRRNRYDATATTDTGADNDNFLVALLRSGAGWQTERNQRCARLEGLLSPESVYNVRYSPARVLRRHGAALAGGLTHQATQDLRFAFGEGNNALLSQLDEETEPVIEGAPVPVEQLGLPLWGEDRYQLTAPVSRAQLRRVLANPYGRVRFVTAAGQRREGWLLEFKHTAATGLADLELVGCATLLPD